MTFTVMTHGQDNMYLFLVDRTKIKNRWWSYDWTDAMQFNKESAAKVQASKLRYKEPTVITIDEAIKLTKMNNINDSFYSETHPFSSEGLGQS